MNRRLAAFAALAFLCGGASSLAAEISAPLAVANVEGITEYRLDNGLRILLAPDASKPTTTVNVTYLVGSRMEKYGETGMAHLLEHLMFKGTDAEPDETIDQEFAKRGMRFNGTTWLDRTNYFETFAASDDNLDWALRMEADRMVNSHIWRKDLDSEMTVVRNEMEAGENQPFRILWEKMTASAYQWHNYGKSTIGARADVENVNIEHLQTFYRQYYQPDNAVLIVTGKFDAAKTLARVAGIFGAIAKPGRALEPLWTVEPVQDGARNVVLSRVGDIQIVGALYHIPQAASADFPAIAVLDEILGDTPNGRLYKALVEKKLASQVGEMLMGLHDPGYTMFAAFLDKTQSRDKAARALIPTVEEIKKAPLTEAELDRAKISLANDYEKMLNDPAAFGVRLSESIAAGDWRLLFLNRDRIAAVTLADLQRVADAYFKESNRTSGQFVPTEKPDRAVMPDPVDVAKLVADYKGHEALEAGEDFDPSPANIESRTRRTTLANGMQVAELVKKTRGNTVNGAITLNFGDAANLTGKSILAQASGKSLLMGAGKLGRKEIADRLDALKTHYSVNPGSDRVTMTFETRRDKLSELLDLLGDILRNPTFPDKEWQETRTEWLTGIDAGRRQPGAVAQNALARTENPYPKGDIRYAETFDEQVESVKSVKSADLKAFHTGFYGADHAQLALVGDFDPAAIDPQLKRLFGGWKAKSPYARVPHPFHEMKPSSQQFETPDKANANYLAAIAIPIKDDDPAFIPLLLGNQILGSGGLKNRLVDRLRQKDGISYGAGSGLSGNAFEAHSSWFASAIYAPQNLDKLKTDIAEVLDSILKDGVTEQELTEAKSGLLQSWTIARTQDGALAGTLAAQSQTGRTMAFVADRETQVNAASVEQVNATLRRYLDTGHMIQIYAGDFAGAARKGAPSP